MSIDRLTNTELLQQFSVLVQTERKVLTRVLVFINEIELRKIHLLQGFASLFDFLTRHYGYSEGSAIRRINAARLLREVPTCAAQIENGKLNLSQLNTARQMFRTKEVLSLIHI